MASRLNEAAYPGDARSPLIGITVGPREEGSAYLQTRWTYAHAIEVAGGLPVLIPPLGPDALAALLGRLDGIVFPGGADVDPAEYGEAREPKTEVVSELDRPGARRGALGHPTRTCRPWGSAAASSCSTWPWAAR